MSFTINWNKLPSSAQKKNENSSRKPLNFIKFTNDSTHIVRPVGKAYGFWRFWYKPAHRYIGAKVMMDDDGNVMESNLEELKELLECEPEQRFAMNVIDRGDKEIKVLQGPMNMLQDFAEVAQETGNKPGGVDGGDWRITSKGAGKSRRYHSNFLGPSPFSKEEIDRIKNPDKEKNEWYILEQVYKPADMEYVKKLVAGESAEDKPAPTAEGEAAPVGAAVGDDDLDF